jgi:hypothetical protein
VSVQVCGDIARADRVDFDGCALELFGEENSKSIQGCFGSIVGQGGRELCDGRVGIAVDVQGTHLARYIHNAPSLGVAQQGEHGFGDSEDAEDIGGEGLLQIFKRELTGWRAPFANGDSRIVDQNIQSPIGLTNEGGGGIDANLIGHIEMNDGGFYLLGTQFLDGGLSSGQVACTNEDGDVLDTQLTRDLKTDPFVRSSNECGLFFPERKTLLKQLSFERCQVSDWIFAEAEALTTSFFANLELRAKVAPFPIISGL